MSERQRWIGTRVVTVVVALLALASRATATEGGLVLEPDFQRTLPLLILVFALLVIPLNLLIFRPIFRVLDARGDQIDGNRARAERVSERADEVLERYQRAILEVREDAERDRRARIEAVRSETAQRAEAARVQAEAEISRAREEVIGALVEARTSLRAQAEELAIEAASRILGRDIS